MKSRHALLAAMAFPILAVLPARAIEAQFRFDSVPSGRPANTAASAGVTFEPAVFAPLLDGDGLPIAGSSAWRADGSAPEVTVDDPSRFGRGAAPSPINALNALFQPVLVKFASPQVIREFGVTLDADAFGDRDLGIEFFDGGDRLLATILIDQTQPGFSVNSVLSLVGVDRIALPAGAFYDNIRVSSVPEPGLSALLLAGAVTLLARRRPGC